MAGMWARLQADLNVKLRRGAWYRITRLDPLRAVLEVGGRLLEIPSAFLQVIERPPRRWSVVPRPNDAVRLPAGWGERYAVCPRCRGRPSLAGRPRRLPCRRCGEGPEPVTVESRSNGARAAATQGKVLSRPTVRCTETRPSRCQAVS